jgi:hypothetical protein
MSALYNKIRGKKTAQTTATASAVTAPQPVVLQSSPQQPKVSKEVFNTNANKALDAIYKTPKIKNDLLNFTYNLKDDDRGKLINVLNSGDNKSMYDNIKANIRSEIETSNAVDERVLPSVLSSSMPRPDQDLGSAIGIGELSSPSSARRLPTPPPPPPSRQLSEEDPGSGVGASSRQLSDEDIGRGVELGLPEASSSLIEDNAIKDNAATTIQRTMRGRLSRKDQTSGGGRRRTKKSKYYNKRRRTKGRRTKRRRSNKRRN